MIACAEAVVRHPRPGEELPDRLAVAFPCPRLDWVWLLEVEQGPVAALYGSDMHGVAHLVVLRMLQDAPRSGLVTLLRAVREDLLARGYRKVFCWLSATKKAETKLARVFQRLGGSLFADSGWFAITQLDGRKW